MIPAIMSLLPHFVYQALCYFLPLFLAYTFLDAWSTRRLVGQQSEYPLIGAPFSAVPKFILNLLYAWKATELCQEGFEKVLLASNPSPPRS